MSLTCQACGVEISKERIKIHVQLHGKDPETCVGCCTTKKKRGLQVYNCKTNGEVVIVPDDNESWRIAQRAYQRAR